MKRRYMWPTVGFALAALASSCLTAQASPGYAVLHRFGEGRDGIQPKGGLIADAAGDLYGTTFNGGGPLSEGTVFELMPPARGGGSWREVRLHAFPDLSGGQYPWAGLVADSSGDLYGTTWLGGNGPCADQTCGVAFELVPPTQPGTAWTYTDINDFNGYDGGAPRAAMVIDAQGNLFGTTTVGGNGLCYGGCGVVFELSRSGSGWTEQVLYDFPAFGRGSDVTGGTGGPVTLDASGNLYGTSFIARGAAGEVFELQRPASGSSWKYLSLHRFTANADGMFPQGGLTFDAAGNLFGTTQMGGTPISGCYGSGCGTVFELTPSAGTWTYDVIYRFRGTGDGGLPQDTLTFSPSGNIYSTTPNGGTGPTCTGPGCGVLFRLTPPRKKGGRWTQATLHTFGGAAGEGYVPYGGVIFGAASMLYGPTQFGGRPTCGSGLSCGTVYTRSP